MTKTQLEKELLKHSKELSVEVLEEVVGFVKSLQKKIHKPFDNISVELSLLDSSQTSHLMKEFKDYKKLYPVE